MVKEAFAFFLLVTTNFVWADGVPQQEKVRQRIEPVGQVEVKNLAAQTKHTTSLANVKKGTGQVVYEKSCVMCHHSTEPLIKGIGAPAFRDRKAWKPRLAKLQEDKEAFLKSVVNGLGAMPPNGACADCSKDQIKAAIQYMLPQNEKEKKK